MQRHPSTREPIEQDELMYAGAIVRDAMVQVASGLALGIPAAFFGKRFVETQLYEMQGLNLVIVAVSALVMLIATSSGRVLSPPGERLRSSRPRR